MKYKYLCIFKEIRMRAMLHLLFCKLFLWKTYSESISFHKIYFHSYLKCAMHQSVQRCMEIKSRYTKKKKKKSILSSYIYPLLTYHPWDVSSLFSEANAGDILKTIIYLNIIIPCFTTGLIEPVLLSYVMFFQIL